MHGIGANVGPSVKIDSPRSPSRLNESFTVVPGVVGFTAGSRSGLTMGASKPLKCGPSVQSSTVSVTDEWAPLPPGALLKLMRSSSPGCGWGSNESCRLREYRYGSPKSPNRSGTGAK